jgi:hypothetical protein
MVIDGTDLFRKLPVRPLSGRRIFRRRAAHPTGQPRRKCARISRLNSALPAPGAEKLTAHSGILKAPVRMTVMLVESKVNRRAGP